MENDTLDNAFGRAIAAAMEDPNTAEVFVAIVGPDGTVGSGSTILPEYQLSLLEHIIASLRERMPEVETKWVNRKTGEMRDSDPEKVN